MRATHDMPVRKAKGPKTKGAGLSEVLLYKKSCKKRGPKGSENKHQHAKVRGAATRPPGCPEMLLLLRQKPRAKKVEPGKKRVKVSKNLSKGTGSAQAPRNSPKKRKSQLLSRASSRPLSNCVRGRPKRKRKMEKGG